jgi:hypothetical protein
VLHLHIENNFMFHFSSYPNDLQLYDLSPVNKAFRTSSFKEALIGKNFTVKTATTNGGFSISGCGADMSSYAWSGKPTKGTADNEFGAWMDAHDLFRSRLKSIYGEHNTSDLECDLRYLRINTPTWRSQTRYLLVPQSPIVLADHAGNLHQLDGIEAGIAWTALAWLETRDAHGTTGTDLISLHGTRTVRDYVEGFASDLGKAACQFQAGAALLN